MNFRQQGAVLRRKIRPDWTRINMAQASLLPQQKRIEDERDYQNRLYDLNERNFKRNFALSREALDEQKKRAKKAEQLGYANLGLSAVGGLAREYADSDLNSAKDMAKPVLQNATRAVGSAADAATKATPDTGFLSKLASSDPVESVKKPLTEGFDLASQGLGALYQNTLGKVVDWIFKE